MVTILDEGYVRDDVRDVRRSTRGRRATFRLSVGTNAEIRGTR
jgi:hypothetical protein